MGRISSLSWKLLILNHRGVTHGPKQKIPLQGCNILFLICICQSILIFFSWLFNSLSSVVYCLLGNGSFLINFRLFFSIFTPIFLYRPFKPKSISLLFQIAPWLCKDRLLNFIPGIQIRVRTVLILVLNREAHIHILF